MDSSGNLYKPSESRPEDAIEIESPVVVARLEDLNHRARRVYYSERRRGKDEEEALRLAVESLPR